MKTISTVRFRPKPEYFDFVADQLKKRADHWASRGTTAKVYLVQDDDELIFQIILDGMDTLIESQDRVLRPAGYTEFAVKKSTSPNSLEH